MINSRQFLHRMYEYVYTVIVFFFVVNYLKRFSENSQIHLKFVLNVRNHDNQFIGNWKMTKTYHALLSALRDNNDWISVLEEFGSVKFLTLLTNEKITLNPEKYTYSNNLVCFFSYDIEFA